MTTLYMNLDIEKNSEVCGKCQLLKEGGHGSYAGCARHPMPDCARYGKLKTKITAFNGILDGDQIVRHDDCINDEEIAIMLIDITKIQLMRDKLSLENNMINNKRKKLNENNIK